MRSLGPPAAPLAFLIACSKFHRVAQASYTPFLPQSFFFNFNSPIHPTYNAVTSQCDTVHLTWERGNATGPTPTAPYFLQVYTTEFAFPVVVEAGSGQNFDWTIPFVPGTLYQICMFDSRGNTGGCQRTYSVISTTESTACKRVAWSPGLLDVEGLVEDGPMTRLGWADQCTDITITPKNGTPPYILTIAPPMRSPYNITADNMGSINWTVSLFWSTSFFVSIVDARGNSWATGPLYSGGNGPSACLTLSDTASIKGIGPGIAVGTGVGGLAIGSLLGILSAYLFMRHRRREELRGAFMHMSSASPLLAPTHNLQLSSISPHYSSESNGNSSNNDDIILHRLTRGETQYKVERFVDSKADNDLAFMSTHTRDAFRGGERRHLPVNTERLEPPRRRDEEAQTLHEGGKIMASSQ